MLAIVAHLRRPLRLERARELRQNMTDAERVLWSEVRRKQIFGAQFYRQKPIDQFVVDSYCPAAQLVIEVDGEQQAPSGCCGTESSKPARSSRPPLAGRPSGRAAS